MPKPILSIEQLKAFAYDCMGQVELWQNRLDQANKMIKEYKAPAPAPEEVPKSPEEVKVDRENKDEKEIGNTDDKTSDAIQAPSGSPEGESSESADSA